MVAPLASMTPFSLSGYLLTSFGSRIVEFLPIPLDEILPILTNLMGIAYALQLLTFPTCSPLDFGLDLSWATPEALFWFP